jgi:hypothetical protein
MVINTGGKHPVLKIGSRSLLLMELDSHLVLMDAQELGTPLRHKRGSVTLRTKKGMKVRAALRDLISKGKAAYTEAVIIDMS